MWNPNWHKGSSVNQQVVIGVIVGGLLLTSLASWLLSTYELAGVGVVSLTGLVAVICAVAILVITSNVIRAHRLRDSFSGMLSAGQMRSLLGRIESADFAASEQVVTVMFIDLVEFAEVAESKPPNEMFQQLHAQYRRIAEIVHSYNGIVANRFDYGLVAFFGYGFHDNSVVTDHADKGLRCAIELQETLIKEGLASYDAGRMFLPIRIGLATGGVCLGNVAYNKPVDFALVGNGVNEARLLQESCEPYRILYSEPANDLVNKSGLVAAGFEKRLMQSANGVDVTTAYEYDPFCKKAEITNLGRAAMQKQTGIERRETRFTVIDRGAISVATDHGDGFLLDFSMSGLAVELDKYLAKGVALSLQLDNKIGGLKVGLRCCELQPFSAVVRWARPSVEGWFRHGLEIRNMTPDKRESLVAFLRENVRFPESS